MTTLNGTSASDNLVGTPTSDTISGGAGSDTLYGLGGSDTLNGGSGSDTLYGGGGNDELNGGSGDDTLYGGDGRDELNGGSGNDALYGGNGSDELEGGSGNDYLSGGNGNDELEGGSGNDVLLGGAGRDELEGGSGNDVLVGGSGNDELEGNSGNDILIGSAGADWLEGDSGNDIFRYMSESESGACDWDRILDFKQGTDKIDLAALLGDVKLAWGGKSFTTNGAWFENWGSSTFVYANVGGTGVDFKIELKNTCGLNLTCDDFIGVGANIAPVAENFVAGFDEDTSLAGQLVASDAEHDPVRFELVAGPANGKLTLNDNGSFSYVPNPNFHGEDSFTYKVNDGSSDSNVATVSLTVNAVNDAPVAQGQSGETGEDKDFTGQLVATDVDGDTLTYSEAVDVDGVTVNSDGSFTVSTAAHQDLDDGETRDVTFSYLADDGAMTSSASVTVTLHGANDAPETLDVLDVATNEDMVVAGSVAGSSTDVDGDNLTFDVQGATPDGLIFDEMTGDWSFDPRVHFNSLDTGESAEVTFRYRAHDGDAHSNISEVKIAITGVNDAPVANADSNDNPNNPFSGNVLENDSDPESHAVSFTGFSFTDPGTGDTTPGDFDDALPGNHGYVTIDRAGNWSYTKFAGDEGGEDVFEYSISDGHGGTATGTLTVTVPASSGFSASQTSSVEVMTVADTPAAPADDTSSGGGGGSGASSGNGTSYSYGGNTAPVAVADDVQWMDGGIFGNVLANDSDPDAGDSLFVTEVKGYVAEGDPIFGDYGFLMITSTGDWTYGLNAAGTAAIAAGTSGVVDVFEYSIQDASGAAASSYLAVHLTDGDAVL